MSNFTSGRLEDEEENPMSRVYECFSKFLKDESGASAAEYALILAIVTTGIAGATIVLGNEINEAIREAANCISEATSAGCTN